MRKKNDLKGQKFGRLLVVDEAEYYTKSGSKQKGYLCQCDCGNRKVISSSSLKSGKTKSCGCLIREFNAKRYRYYQKTPNINDDQRKKDIKRISRIYNHMKQRCYNSNTHNYSSYGGRGIRICDEWLNDKNTFVAWALDNGYREDLSIDRIDVNGDYSPSNCRWADKITQANNMRSNTHIYYNGKKYTVTELSRVIGVERHALSDIAKIGISLNGKDLGNIRNLDD